MYAAKAQSSLLHTVSPMAGESMTAHILRTWGLFAVQKGELVSQLSLRRNLLHPLGVRQARGDQHSLYPLQQQPLSPLLLQEAMRLPSIATQHLPVAAASPRRKTATRSRSCNGIEVVPEPVHRLAQLCHRATSYLHVWQTAHPTGRGWRWRGPIHKQGDEREAARKTDSLSLKSSQSGGVTGISSSAGTMLNQSLLIRA